MLEQTADVVTGHLREVGITGLIMEEGLAVLPQRLVDVHAGTTVISQWLGHEGGRLAHCLRGVLHHVLEGLEIIGCVQQGVETVVDLLLTTTAHLMVGALHGEPDLRQGLADGVTQILEVVIRRHREVTTLLTDLVAEVPTAVRVLPGTAVPPALHGIHLVEGRVRLGAETHGVEDVELGLGTEVAAVGEPGRSQVLLRLAGDVARIPGKRLPGVGIMDEELDVQRLRPPERVDERGGQVRQQHHVGIIDGGVSADR